MRARTALAALAALVGAACRSLPPPAEVRTAIQRGEVQGRSIVGVPFVEQTPHGCGPAALASILQFHGAAIREEEIESGEVVPDRLGTATFELALAARRAGFFARDVRFVCSADPSPMRKLLAILDEGVPVVVLVKRGLPLFERYHYLAVTGYDDTRGLVLYQDGYEADAVDDYVSFQDDWHGGEHWALVVFPPDREYAFLSAEDRLELAEICEGREMWEAAERHYSAVLRERPAERDALIGRAGALSHLRREDEAAAAFERALAADPNDPRALNNFAQHLVRSRGDLARAEALARRAASSGEGFAPYADDTLGQVLAARGDLAGARSAFEAAIAACGPGQEALKERIRRRLEALRG